MPYKPINLDPTDGPIHAKGPSPSFVYGRIRDNQHEIWKNRLRLGSKIWNAGPIQYEQPTEFELLKGWPTDLDHQQSGVRHDLSTSCLEFSTPPWQWTCIPLNWPASVPPAGHRIDLKIRLGLWVRNGVMEVRVDNIANLRLNTGVTATNSAPTPIGSIDVIRSLYSDFYTPPAGGSVTLSPSDDFQVIELTIENFVEVPTSLEQTDRQDVLSTPQIAIAFRSVISLDAPNPSPTIIRVGERILPGGPGAINLTDGSTYSLYNLSTIVTQSSDVSGSDSGWPDTDGKFHGIIRLPALLGQEAADGVITARLLDYYVVAMTRVNYKDEQYEMWFLDRPIDKGLQQFFDFSNSASEDYPLYTRFERIGYTKLNWVQIEEIAVVDS